MAAGYSTTPQIRKLGIMPGHVVVLAGQPQGWALDDPPDVDLATAPEHADVVLGFVRNATEVPDTIAQFQSTVHPAGALWILWPRKAAGYLSDVSENLIRETALGVGLVDVKVAAVDEAWSGLKLVWRKENR